VVVSAHFDVSVHRRADGVDVELAGELDAAAVFTLEPVLEDIAIEADTREIVFDLRKVTFVDSAGLAVLVATQERLEGRDVQMSFIRPQASVMRVFEVTGLDTAFAFRRPEEPGADRGQSP
jgi:anti-sigma B factor antagonist